VYFKSDDWEAPKGTVFNDETFLYVCNQLRDVGEVAVNAVIGSLIVPLACVGIVRGHVPFKRLIDGIRMRRGGDRPIALG
jgi:hypothetical protein